MDLTHQLPKAADISNSLAATGTGLRAHSSALTSALYCSADAGRALARLLLRATAWRGFLNLLHVLLLLVNAVVYVLVLLLSALEDVVVLPAVVGNLVADTLWEHVCAACRRFEFIVACTCDSQCIHIITTGFLGTFSS